MPKLRIAIIIVLSMFVGVVLSQPVSAANTMEHEWTKSFGGTLAENENASSVVADEDGNVYIVGSFESASMDFDPGAGTVTHSSNGDEDAYLSKFDEDGDHQWTRVFGGANQDWIVPLVVNDGYVYIAGAFTGTNVDMDGTAGTDLFSSSGDTDAFITKYDTSGNYQWTKVIGGSGSDSIYGLALYQNYLYWFGAFEGSNIDMDVGTGTDLHSAVDDRDVMLLKYDLNANYQWGRSFGGVAQDSAGEIVVDDDGVYLVGSFEGTNVDLDGTSGTDLHSSNGDSDGYIVKYEHDGDYGWGLSWGANNGVSDQPLSLGIYNSKLYMAKAFGGTTDLDATAGTDNYSTSNVGSTALCVYTTSGTYDDCYHSTLTTIGNFGITTLILTVGDNGEIYVYTEIADFFMAGSITYDLDLSSGTDSHVAAAQGVHVLSKYDSDMNYKWSYPLDLASMSAIDLGGWISTDSNRNIYLSSAHNGTSLDLDFTSGSSTHTTSGDYDAFFSRYRDVHETAIQNLDAGLDATNVDAGVDAEVQSESNYEEMTTVRLETTGGLVLAEVETDLTDDRSWDGGAAAVDGDMDVAAGRSFVHNITSAEGTASSFTLYIPKRLGQDGVYICPGADELTDVTLACAGGYALSEGAANLSSTRISGQDYWVVSGLTGTGGLGTGGITSTFIDLVAEPATTPSNINTAPEVAVSTADEFYISYIPSSTEFASADYVDVVIPSDWSGLGTCASSTTDADGDSTADGSMAVQDSQIIRFTFSAATTTALSTGVEFCFAATTPAAAGNYSIAISDVNDGDYSAALVYVGDDNDVTVTASVPASLSLRIKEPTTTSDTNSCALGVLNPGSVNSCAYRIAAGTNGSAGLEVFVLADATLDNAGATADIDDTPADTDVEAGTEAHGVAVTAGTGFTLGSSFAQWDDNPVPQTETLILDAAAAVSDSDTGTWSTVTHSASIDSSTAADSYTQIVTYRVWVDT